MRNVNEKVRGKRTKDRGNVANINFGVDHVRGAAVTFFLFAVHTIDSFLDDHSFGSVFKQSDGKVCVDIMINIVILNILHNL